MNFYFPTYYFSFVFLSENILLIQLLYRPLHRNLTITKTKRRFYGRTDRSEGAWTRCSVIFRRLGWWNAVSWKHLSNVSATVGNGISTFPDYPADIRAPQGSLNGVSGYRVQIGAGKVYTPGDKCDVLVAMNAAALKNAV